MQSLIPIGKIIGAHGIKGNLKVKLFTETLAFFEKGRSIRVVDKSGEDRRFIVDWSDPYKTGLLLCLEGVSDRVDAEALIGSEILVSETELPEPEEGSYYWRDLIGLRVWTHDDLDIGVIDSIIETGSNDVYVVKKGNEEILIPALESVVLKIDLENKTMRVKIPDGLL